MRLIDADKLNRKDVNCANVPMNFIDIAPTVEAIPKDQYEAKLKDDKVAMLTDLQLEIEEIVKEEELIDKKWAKGLHYSEKIIQQKIDKLKGNKNGNGRNEVC